MKEEFEKLVTAGKLEKQLVEPLTQLTNSGYCMHRSWGFGKITTVDTVFARFAIDFRSPQINQHNFVPRRQILLQHVELTQIDGHRERECVDAVHRGDLVEIVEGRGGLEHHQQVAFEFADPAARQQDDAGSSGFERALRPADAPELGVPAAIWIVTGDDQALAVTCVA